MRRLLALVLLTAAGCGTVASVGRPAPPFAVESFAGETLRSESLAGKVVVLDFWTSWCGPCRRTLPGLATVVDEYEGRDDVAILAVNATWNDTREDATAFLLGSRAYVPAYWDGTRQMARDYGVRAIPTTVVIGKDGRVAHLSKGGGSAEAYATKVRREVEAALAAAEAAAPDAAAE